VAAPVGEERNGFRALVGLGAAILIAAGLKAAAGILEPIVFALFLGVLTLPLFAWLRRRGLPLALAVTVTVLVLVAFLASFVVLLLGSLGEVREVGPSYWRELNERLSYTVDWWAAKGVAVGDWVPDSWSDGSVLFGVAGDTLKVVLTFLSEATIALLTLVFLLFEFATFPDKLKAAPRRVQEGFARFRLVSRQLQRYVLIKTMMSALIGVSVALWLAFLGVDFAVLLGLVAFGAHFIPNIGALLAAAPAMLFAFVQFDVAKALVVGAGFLVIGTLLGNLAEPALMGHRLGMSPLVVFLSLVVWGWIWGAVGMFLSVPLTMTVKILLEHHRSLGWVAALLESGAGHPGVPPSPAAAGEDAGELAAAATGAEGGPGRP
jgi:predicted PurR-regulated permease PerM